MLFSAQHHFLPVYKGRLSPEVTAKFQRSGTRKPDQRLNDIVDGIQRPDVGYKDSHFLRAAGIEIEKNPLEIQASVLAPPRILFGSNQQVWLYFESDRFNPRYSSQLNKLMVNGGAWNMRDNQFFKVK
jgi:hypothetical protein